MKTKVKMVADSLKSFRTREVIDYLTVLGMKQTRVHFDCLRVGGVGGESGDARGGGSGCMLLRWEW